MDRTEELIVMQLREGNEWAYKFLYDHHYRILCHVAAQYVHDDFLAETIVSDVIFHLWEVRENLEIKTGIRSYLLSSVKHRFGWLRYAAAVAGMNANYKIRPIPLTERQRTNYSLEQNPGYDE